MTTGAAYAHDAVYNAIKSGRLEPITKDTKCVDCGKRARVYDHRDYNHPLKVDPVCNYCNDKRGSAIPRMGRNEKNDSLERFKIYLPAKSLAELRKRSKTLSASVSRQVREAVEEYLMPIDDRLALLRMNKVTADFLKHVNIDLTVIKRFAKTKKLKASKSKTIRFKRAIPFKTRSTNT